MLLRLTLAAFLALVTLPSVASAMDIGETSWYQNCVQTAGNPDQCMRDAELYRKGLYSPSFTETVIRELPADNRYQASLIAQHEECVMHCFEVDASQQCMNDCQLAYPF